MNKLAASVVLTLLTSSAVFAQSAGPGVDTYNTVTTTHSVGHDVTGFTARTSPGTSVKEANRPPNPNVVLRPKTGGILVDGPKYGWVMISPVAPAEYGNGEKYLAAPSSQYDVDHESGPAAHRDTGGFKLFSLEF